MYPFPGQVKQATMIVRLGDDRTEHTATRTRAVKEGHVYYETWEIKGLGEWSWYSDHRVKHARIGNAIGSIDGVSVYHVRGGPDGTTDDLGGALAALFGAF